MSYYTFWLGDEGDKYAGVDKDHDPGMSAMKDAWWVDWSFEDHNYPLITIPAVTPNKLWLSAYEWSTPDTLGDRISDAWQAIVRIFRP